MIVKMDVTNLVNGDPWCTIIVITGSQKGPNVSSLNWGFLGHQHPALWYPAPCNIRGACLGKY